MLGLFLLVHSVRIWNNASRFNDDMTGISAVSCQISLGKKKIFYTNADICVHRNKFLKMTKSHEI